MTINRLIVPDIDHWNISGIVEDFIKNHELPVLILCYTDPVAMDQVMSVVYKRGCSISMRKQGDLVEILVE